MYIEDRLWDMMSEDASDPTEKIIEQMEKIFEGINKHLDNLDNGGYIMDFDKKVVKLDNSDIVLKNTYVDRVDGNVTKVFDADQIWALTFAFQESVELLRNRNAVDLRILMTHKSKSDSDAEKIGMAEELCLCNPQTFACIAVFAIEHLNYWAYQEGVFTHEIGHSLGMDAHDDDFYTANPGDRLLMWSAVGSEANIWSPEAKRRINQHNKSCLATTDFSSK